MGGFRHNLLLSDTEINNYIKAGERWREFWSKYGRIPSFGSFIFDPLIGNPSWREMRDIVVERINILSGPYWYAFLMAYKIKRGGKDVT